MYFRTLLFAVQFNVFSSMFVMVFIYCLLSFFRDAADNDHSYLVEIPVERSIFELRFADI